MSLSKGTEENSYYSSIYKKDVHVEQKGGSYYIADSSGRPVGAINGYMSKNRGFVEGQMRGYY